MRFRLLVLFSFLFFSFHLNATETSEGGATHADLVRCKNELQGVLTEDSVEEGKALNLASKVYVGYKELSSPDSARVTSVPQLFLAVRKTLIDAYIYFAGLKNSKESVRLLLENIGKIEAPTHRTEEFKEAQKAFLESEKAILTRQERLATYHGAALERVQFVDSLERIFAELVEFSHKVEGESGFFARKLGNHHKCMRRNMVWMFREDFGPEWKTHGEDSSSYKRLNLILEAYEKAGVQAAYELCDLTHKIHRENGTQKRNTSSLIASLKHQDVTLETLRRHLSLLEPEGKEDPSKTASEVAAASEDTNGGAAAASVKEGDEATKASEEEESKEGEEPQESKEE